MMMMMISTVIVPIFKSATGLPFISTAPCATVLTDTYVQWHEIILHSGLLLSRFRRTCTFRHKWLVAERHYVSSFPFDKRNMKRCRKLSGELTHYREMLLMVEWVPNPREQPPLMTHIHDA
jgi:hypothetical protein